eukprot:CAMPEP_0179090494 /NCGR_PEP_ID=MMETSP0796-20121207/41290_1 /TAXON_ID=73915 /ORGANISM="Pyrodinium bahamense, Strain pbaha01" /LENGTH=240 /DNA_ID=CAMNT_0020788069 /DNA_START=67 /DNA_END=789 /DNA_ORIENTATION=-
MAAIRRNGCPVRVYGVLTALMVLAAALSAASPTEEAFAADDECSAVGSATCALEALQQRQEAKAATTPTGPVVADAKSEAESGTRLEAGHEALLEAMARGGVRAEHLAEARAQLAAGVATQANASSSCMTWTGGTCAFSDCAASRGAVKCESLTCNCVQGFCAKGGKCVFDMDSAANAWGGQPQSGGTFDTSSGSSWTGGTCLHVNCDASRGPTECGMTTGFQCLCKSGFKAHNGMCVFR